LTEWIQDMNRDPAIASIGQDCVYVYAAALERIHTWQIDTYMAD
jgi:hypothetical protein